MALGGTQIEDRAAADGARGSGIAKHETVTGSHGRRAIEHDLRIVAIAGRNAAAIAKGEPPQAAPRTTAIGSLAYYVSHADPATYQPTNITHGIMPPLDNPPRDKMKKKLLIAERALADLDRWLRPVPVLS